MKVSIFSAAAISVLLAATPALHAENLTEQGKRLAEIRYDNYLYCQAFSLEQADAVKDKHEEHEIALTNATGFAQEAKILQDALNMSDATAAENLEDARLEIYLKVESLESAEEVATFDKKFWDHCAAVAGGEEELEKEWSW